MTLIIILISGLSIISTVIGVGLAYFLAKDKKIINFSFGFSAAVILLLSLFELLLEPLKYAGAASIFAFFLLGVFMILILDWLIPHFHFFNQKQGQLKLLKIGYLIAFGLIIHDLPEGFSIASTYSVEKNWGLLVGLLIALHNIPEEFILAFPFILSKKTSQLVVLAVLSSLAEPAGAILGIFTLTLTKNNLAPLLTVFAGGAMAAIAIKELLPLGLKSKLRTEFYFGLIIGAFSYFLLKFLI
jgi:ZIP family zinc transporter